MQALKPLTPEGTTRALAKAERYRFLGEPCEAESIYRDVLAGEPDLREARIGLILALTDQFRMDLSRAAEASALVHELEDRYERLYYSGVVAERKGKAQLDRGAPSSGDSANRLLHEAMRWYEKAEAIRPTGEDDALIRWNACARTIDRRGYAEPRDMSLPGLLMTE